MIFFEIEICVDSDDVFKPDFKELAQSDNHHNKAIENATKYLRSLNSLQKKIGILITNRPKEIFTRVENGKNINRIMPHSVFINNIYSHVYKDKSNWITVEEALSFLKELNTKI